MMTTNFAPLPQLDELPEAERTATVKWLLQLSHQQREQLIEQSQQLALQAEQLALQAEQIQLLKDEIAVLKGEKARPKIKPSNLNKPPPGGSGAGAGKPNRGRGKPSRKKTAQLTIHEECVIEPSSVPPGWVLKEYEPYVVQELEIRLKNTRYLRARYESPRASALKVE